MEDDDDDWSRNEGLFEFAVNRGRSPLLLKERNGLVVVKERTTKSHQTEQKSGVRKVKGRPGEKRMWC
jgi:hypothetical protein